MSDATHHFICIVGSLTGSEVAQLICNVLAVLAREYREVCLGITDPGWSVAGTAGCNARVRDAAAVNVFTEGEVLFAGNAFDARQRTDCLLYTSPSPRD